jgi:hypothetical protein
VGVGLGRQEAWTIVGGVRAALVLAVCEVGLVLVMAVWGSGAAGLDWAWVGLGQGVVSAWVDGCGLGAGVVGALAGGVGSVSVSGLVGSVSGMAGGADLVVSGYVHSVSGMAAIADLAGITTGLGTTTGCSTHFGLIADSAGIGKEALFGMVGLAD